LKEQSAQSGANRQKGQNLKCFRYDEKGGGCEGRNLHSQGGIRFAKKKIGRKEEMEGMPHKTELGLNPFHDNSSRGGGQIGSW